MSEGFSCGFEKLRTLSVSFQELVNVEIMDDLAGKFGYLLELLVNCEILGKIAGEIK